MDIDESEDEVIKEFDVCLNKEGCGTLYLFRHSLDAPTLEAAKFRAKPLNKVFEIELDRPAGRPQFNGSRRKRRDSVEESEEKQQIMRSTRTKPVVPQVLGVIRADIAEIHFTPVDSIIEFKPTYTTVAESNAEAEAAVAAAAALNEPEAKVQAVRLRFAGVKDEANKKARLMSYAHKQQKEAAEKWVELLYCPVTSVDSKDARSSLTTIKAAEEIIAEEGGSELPEMSTIEEILKTLTCFQKKQSAEWDTAVEPSPSRPATVSHKRRSSAKDSSSGQSPRQQSPGKRKGRR